MDKNRDYIGYLIILFLIICGYIFSPFLKYFAVALILSISTAPIFNYLNSHNSTSKRVLVSLGITLLTIMFLFFPMLYLANIATSNTLDIKELSTKIFAYKDVAIGFLNKLPEFLSPVLQTLKDTILSNESAKIIGDVAFSIIKGFGKIINDIIFIIIFFTVFNIYGYSIFKKIYILLPLNRIEKKEVIKNGFGTISLILYSSLFNIFAMGISFGIFVALISDLDALLFGLMAGFSSIIPVVGAMLVYVPLFFYFITEGEILKAILTLLFGGIFMGFVIDNILRIFFIKYTKQIFAIKSNINEITLMISMIAGVSTFGFWGIIIAPAVVSILLVLIRGFRYGRS